VPVDAKLLSDRDMDFEAVSLKQVMQEMEGAHSLRVVILEPPSMREALGPTQAWTSPARGFPP